MLGELSKEQLKTKLAEAAKHTKEGDLDNAIILLQEILEQDQHHEISLGMLASIYLQIGLHDRAIELYEKLLIGNPQNPLARFQLGMAYMNTGSPQKALTAWEPMLEMKDEFMANFHSALAFVQLDQEEEALICLARAFRHMPSNHPLFPQLVNLHTQLTERTA